SVHFYLSAVDRHRRVVWIVAGITSDKDRSGSCVEGRAILRRPPRLIAEEQPDRFSDSSVPDPAGRRRADDAVAQAGAGNQSRVRAEAARLRERPGERVSETRA